MQPLKRFTQCGSLTMLFGIFIVLFGVSSTALTTFGKSPTNSQPVTPGPIVKGVECSSHDDCSPADKTSCVKDPNDYKMRCLCGDDTPPNPQCGDVEKGLRHKCTSSSECEDGMVCQFENTNRTIGVAKFMSTKTKLCLCDNDNGYVEDVVHDICSGAALQSAASLMLSLVITVATLIVKKFRL